jgi:hypothetical protein
MAGQRRDAGQVFSTSKHTTNCAVHVEEEDLLHYKFDQSLAFEVVFDRARLALNGVLCNFDLTPLKERMNQGVRRPFGPIRCYWH